jgi:hypothetical protein
MQLTMFYKDQDILFFSKISDCSENRQRHEPSSTLKESLKTGTTFDSCENSLEYTVLWRSWLHPWTQLVPEADLLVITAGLEPGVTRA